MNIERFEDDQAAQRLLAVGTLSVRVTDAGRQQSARYFNRPVRVSVDPNSITTAGQLGEFGDVQAFQLACNVLNLVLGPLDLNLLGLRVQLNQVNLRITAIPGGGLLGDLLCAVANLLGLGNILGQLTQLGDLLTQIIAIFR